MMYKFHPKVFSCFSTLRGKQRQIFLPNFKKAGYCDNSDRLLKKTG